MLENPDQISKGAGKGLDAGTAFEILSIDIADVDVGGIGAKLRADQAESDKKVAQAEAEAARWPSRPSRRCRRGRWRTARGHQGRGGDSARDRRGVQAGNLGIMDYYKMKNVMADTDMRKGSRVREESVGDHGE